MSAAGFGKSNPIFPVKDAAASVDYYVKVFGFKMNWQGGDFASVSRGDCSLFLCADEQGAPGTWAMVFVDDVDVVVAEWQAKGAKFRMAPQNFIWGYEAHVLDPDGNVMRIIQDDKCGVPYGIWTRDDGARWQQLETGGWKRAE